MSAAMAYYTLFLLAPALLLVTSLTTRVIGTGGLEPVIVRVTQDMLGEELASYVLEVAVTTSEARAADTASLVGVLVLLWAVFVFYSNMQAVFNRLWRVRLRPGVSWGRVLRIRASGFAIMLVPVVLLAAAALSASIASKLDFLLDYAVWGRFAGGVVAVARSPVGVFGLAWPSFAVLYIFLPDARVPWRIAAMAAGEVAAGWTLGTWLFGEYLAWSSGGSAYGAASAVFVLLIWLNYSARLVLLGCKLTKTWTQKVHGSVKPLPHAAVVRIDLETTE